MESKRVVSAGERGGEGKEEEKGNCTGFVQEFLDSVWCTNCDSDIGLFQVLCMFVQFEMLYHGTKFSVSKPGPRGEGRVLRGVSTYFRKQFPNIDQVPIFLFHFERLDLSTQVGYSQSCTREYDDTRGAVSFWKFP